ncbi:MAG: hypothetical protein GF330_11570 [Candidatus Eisenbacteria bacterium]|nr:hypothetical protein [Candidatus Eisenbacteria bacterium]
MIVRNSGYVDVNNFSIHDRSACGIKVYAGGTLDSANNSYADNAGGDECL